MHALNGNYIWYYSFCPRSHSKEWRDSFFLPNGMRVFRYSFYSKDSVHTDEEVHSRLKPQGANLLPFMGSLGARWPPKGRAGKVVAAHSTIQRNAPPFPQGIRRRHLSYDTLTIWRCARHRTRRHLSYITLTL